MGKVYLTGAGPGDIELLTIKAFELVKKADVIIYDHLANSDILELAKKDTKLIYVGKQSGKHHFLQEKINEIIYKEALANEIVVRLKGGDPFVFGRGAEEALYLKKRNIEYEVVPGVTSSISVPAYAGIPVTHRGITTSFRVVTGHEASSKKISQLEWQTFLNDETIVFLMGFHNINLIMNKLIEIGKPKETLCAVVSQGTTSNQQVVVGTIENIASKSKNMQTPAIIIVGDVVKLREEIKWFD